MFDRSQHLGFTRPLAERTRQPTEFDQTRHVTLFVPELEL